ncbi:MAG: hypothetical protein JW908_12585 [Anaerolineales bacterium]|nr:hypothetical protein [Anaerolineales bacterium]
MENQNLDDTMPTPTSEIPPDHPGFDETMPVATMPAIPPKRGKKSPMRLVVLLGIAGLVLAALVSAFGGYRAGISARTNAQATQVAGTLQQQYDLAMQEIQEENYERARQRLEYIVQADPSFPGVTEKLAEVIMQLSITATPTFTPTPEMTPTPDLRGAEELYSQAQQYLYNSDWTNAIDTALILRKNNIDYQPVLVDDIIYTALLNRGKDKILKQLDLEGGIYDLTLAERFGPLDAESQSYLTFSRLYITGASFWELDWGQAVYYFAQVAPSLPNLTDNSGYSANERYRLALIKYGDQLANKKEWCQAADQYAIAISLGTSSAEVTDSFNNAQQKCGGPAQSTESSDATTETATEEPAAEEPQPTSEVPTP